MKRIVVGVIGGILLIVALFIALKKDNFDNMLEKKMTEMTSYKMQGTMDINDGENTKTYNLNLAYLKDNADEYYKVSLYDNAIKQEQMILKNKDGVFVVTPSLKQAFKFKGDWPNNSLKPYLYQSMLKLLEKEHVVSKSKDGYIVTCDVTYDNEPQLVKQEMFFDKELKPIYVKVFNSDGIEMVTIVFSEVSFDVPIDKSIFEVDNNMKNEALENVSSNIDLPLYPMYICGSKLTNVSSAHVGDEIRHILEFSGEKNFTVVEVARKANDEVVMMQVSGEIVDNLEYFGAYDGSALTLYNSEMEVSIYSSDLSVEEMMQVASSLQVVVMK